MSKRTTTLADIGDILSTSDRARRCRRPDDSPEPPNLLPSDRFTGGQYPALRHPRHERRPPTRRDDGNEGDYVATPRP